MKRYIYWILEIFIWFLIIFTILFSVRFFIKLATSHFYDGVLIFQDINGLIVGSPVKYMGAQVGHISEVTIKKDDIIVKYVIDKKNLKIPKGSLATIEFSGLAASKSLEFYPPNNYSFLNDKIVTKNPNRISNFVDTQNDIANFFINIGDKMLNVSEKHIKSLKKILKFSKKFEKVNTTINNINNKENKIIKDLSKDIESTKDDKQDLEEFDTAIDSFGRE